MKIDLFNWRLRIEASLVKTVEVEGINSNIKGSDKHILMWDFDGVPIVDVVSDLKFIQFFFNLSDIEIVKTNNGYHAYCFRPTTWPVCLNILAATPHICKTYFKLGVVRGYWTLRITGRKPSDYFNFVQTLKSSNPADRSVVDRLDTVVYRTAQK